MEWDRDAKRTVIYFWNGRMMFFGRATDASMHRHHAILIAVGVNKAFRLNDGDGWHEHRLAVIDADQPHQFDSDDSHALVLIDPETEIGKHVKQAVLSNAKIKALDIDTVAPLINAINECMRQIYPCQKARDLCDDIIYAISGEREKTDDIDPRVQKALEIINQSPEKKMSTKDLADSVYLSEGRLIHLFKEQVGIPIRRYLLWSRLMGAINIASKRGSLTEAAHEAGFADSAHLSRAFREMFGIKLSDVLKNSQFVQVITCQQFYT